MCDQEQQYPYYECKFPGCPFEATIIKIIRNKEQTEEDMEFICAYHYNNPFKIVEP